MDTHLILDTELKIAEQSELAAMEGKEKIITAQVYDPILMMKYGFFPQTGGYGYNLNDKYVSDWASGMDMKSILFWSSSNDHFNTEKMIEDMFYGVVRWTYSPLETHKLNGVEKSQSFALIMLAPWLLYKSMRPKTDMLLFRSPASKVVAPPNMKTIPVTRYAAGMSRGLYLGESNAGDFCGTFYYHEPESTTLLAYNTSITSFNKYTAMKELNPDSSLYMDEEISGVPLFLDYTNGVIPSDLMMTPQELTNVMSKYYSKTDIGDATELPKIKGYAGAKLGFYALEDDFDQPLCLAGRKNNIDIIILTNMVGSHQVVTEVLDCRDRVESFRNLIFPE